jgi:hypothetical protein
MFKLMNTNGFRVGSTSIGDDIVSIEVGMAKRWERLYASFKDADVYVVVLYPHKQLLDFTGQVIYTAGENGAVLLVDRLCIREAGVLGRWFACDGYIRQVIEFTADEARKRPNYWDRFDCGSVRSNRVLRAHCEQRGAAMEYVPGEVTPLTRADEVLVNAFNMSGTTYFRVPISAWRQISSLAG